jgi:hypothetical protein
MVAAYESAWWTGGIPPVRTSFGLFYSDFQHAVMWFAMVSLPLLAWALWAPTAKLALRVGLLLVLGVAGWGWLLRRAWAGVFWADRSGLYRIYPFAASAAVVLAVVAAYLWRWWRQPSASGRGSSAPICGQLSVTLRIVGGCLALVVAVALGPIWIGRLVSS